MSIEPSSIPCFVSPETWNESNVELIITKGDCLAHIDVLVAMLKRENSDYLLCENFSTTQDRGVINGTWRQILCEWCYSVVDQFDLDRDVVSYAMYYMDRVVAEKTKFSSQLLEKKEIQLLITASLFLAVKVHAGVVNEGTARQKFNIAVFAKLSDGNFSENMIFEAELDILLCLSWKINPPISLMFINVMLQLCPKWHFSPSYSCVMTSIFDMSSYLTELAICDFDFTSIKFSVISYASIILAIDSLPSTSALPYAARVAFLNLLLEHTGLYPAHEEVRRAHKELLLLCPLLSHYESPLPLCDESIIYDGTVSPVRVSDTPNVCVELGPSRLLEAEFQSEKKRARSQFEADGDHEMNVNRRLIHCKNPFET